MEKKVDVNISPYIPLSPDPSPKRPVNGYFEINIKYNRKETDQRGNAEAYKTPSVTISGFVKEKGDTTAIFNTSDEFSAFVRTLQFTDTKIYENWIIEKADERNLLQIKKKTAAPLTEDFVCSFYSLRFNPTNLKGDDGRAVFQVKAEGFSDGVIDEYEITARKIYITEILSFKEDTGFTTKEIGEAFTLSWNSRGDYVQAARLQEDNREPQDVDISGNRTICCHRPAVYKLTVENLNPGTRFSAASYVEIEVSKPVIRSFTADKKYVYAGEYAVLNWEAVSTYGCQINGNETMYAGKGSITVSPDFTDEADTQKAAYRLDAYGYHGKDPMRVHEELLLYRTFWEKEAGKFKGIDLSKIKEGEKIFFDEERYYVFDGKQILVSKDGLSYENLSVLHLEPGYILNETYKCGYYKGRFYIAGLQLKEDVYITFYEIKSGIWKTVFASENGEKFLNGCFCPDERHSRLYFVFFYNKSVNIYEEIEQGWTWTGQAKFGLKITACGCCCREDKLYLSLLFENQKIENYSIRIDSKEGLGELIKQSVISEKEKNIILMNTDNHVLLLGEHAVYDVLSGKKLDICYGGKILAGMDQNPVIICREKDGYARYRLHADEHSAMKQFQKTKKQAD